MNAFVNELVYTFIQLCCSDVNGSVHFRFFWFGSVHRLRTENSELSDVNSLEQTELRPERTEPRIEMSLLYEKKIGL